MNPSPMYTLWHDGRLWFCRAEAVTGESVIRECRLALCAFWKARRALKRIVKTDRRGKR